MTSGISRSALPCSGRGLGSPSGYAGRSREGIATGLSGGPATRPQRSTNDEPQGEQGTDKSGATPVRSASSVGSTQGRHDERAHVVLICGQPRQFASGRLRDTTPSDSDTGDSA